MKEHKGQNETEVKGGFDAELLKDRLKLRSDQIGASEAF